MAGYSDTRQLIIDTLMGRPAGTEIQPEDHQAFALALNDYIRSVELVAGNATPIGFADADTVPIQPNNGQAVYMSSVGGAQMVTFSNFIDQNGSPISVTSTANVIKLVTLLWNGKYWSSQVTSVNAVRDTTNGYLFMGVAIPATDPGTPDQKVFYLASQAGEYTNFGYTLPTDALTSLEWNGERWFAIRIVDLVTPAEVVQIIEDNTLSTLDKNSDKPVGSEAVAKEIFRLQSQIDNIKPIEIIGNVTNAPDEEDITTDANNLLKLKDRPFGKGLGYKILRSDKTFAEQITDPYTIYEVRYDFDLGGETLTLPNNITLRYAGGVLKNGSVKGSSLNTVDMPSEQKALPIFADGVNFDVIGNFVIASEIGMIADDVDYASHNGAILDKVIANGKYLKLDGRYYFGGVHNLTNFTLKITQGTMLIVSSFSLNLLENAGIDIESTALINAGSSLLFNMRDVDYSLNVISIKNCEIDNVGLRVYSVSSLYPETQRSLKSIVIEGNHIKSASNSLAIFVDTVITNEIIFRNNTVDYFGSSLLYIAETNGAVGEGKNVNFYTDVVFEGNVIKGGCNIRENVVYYTPLLVDGVNKVFYRNNIVSNIINSAKGKVAYDAYVSAKEYYSENNIFRNICQIPSDGVQNETYSEIFKSKGGGTIRQANNNIWHIDFDECRKIAEKAGISLSDEQFNAVNNIAIFRFAYTIEDLTFSDNKVTIKGGKLYGTPSSIQVKRALVARNNFNCGKIEHTLLPAWSKVGEIYTFEDNRFYVDEGIVLLGGSFGVFESFDTLKNCDLEICRNVTNTAFEIPFGSMRKQLVEDNIEGLDEIGVIGTTVLKSTNKPSKIFANAKTTSLEKGLHISGCNNVEFRMKVKATELSSNAPNITYFCSVNTDICVEIDGSRKVFKVRLGDTYQVLDEYDNEVMSYDPSSGSNSGWLYKYSSDNAYIVLQGTTTNGVLIRVYSRTEAASNYAIEINDPALNKYSLPPLVESNKGVCKYDTTLGKPIWWDGTKWVDATGTAV